MCFCCCITRKSILIYAIAICSIAFIYGIIAISKFGSSTDIYKTLINRIKYLESHPESSSTKSKVNYNNYYNNDYDDDYNDYYNSNYKKKNNKTRKIQSIYNNPYYPYNYDIYTNSKIEEGILDWASYIEIQSLKYDDLQNKGYGFVKRLKGIENGLGVILFIFPLLFLVINIIFLIFVCGIKEYKVLPDTTFNIFNIIKITCTILSTIFIFLSVLYAILLVVALIQYIVLVQILDSCSIGIIVGMVFGYYGIWYYIILTCAFCNERTHFLNVGCESKPGPEAKYDINGNALTHGNPLASPITVVIPQSQPVLQGKEQNYPVNLNGFINIYLTNMFISSFQQIFNN